MWGYDIIAKKRDGIELTDEEIGAFVKGVTNGEIPDYQVAAFLMAAYIRGMSKRETATLTIEMAKSGDMLDLSPIGGIKVDKHSTGGVGDKTTLICAPIAAACGVKVAKMSGRGLGHTGGTIDKLESIPGFTIDLPKADFFEIVDKIGCAVVGQSGNLCPADKKLYALRDVTATVDNISLIASSVMSKKIAAGADKILLDVKMGSGAFMKTKEDAEKLAREMVDIGDSVGRKTVALVTNMDKPLGRNIGNSLEIIEVCEILNNGGDRELRELSIELAANMIYLGEKADTIEEAREKAVNAVSSGAAFAKLKEMAATQGGDISYINDTSKFELAKVKHEIKAEKSGYIVFTDAEAFGMASVTLGAGRETKESSIDFGAGIVLHKNKGAFVNVGDVIADLYADSGQKCELAAERLKSAYEIGENKPIVEPIIVERIE